MTEVVCNDCGRAFERKIPENLQGIFREIAEQLRVCPDCSEWAEKREDAKRSSDWKREHADRVRRRLIASRIPEMLQGLTWDRVAPGAWPEAIDAARRWARGELRGLFLAGPVGVGKTWVAAAAANARLEHGRLRWVSAPVLLAHLSLSFDNPLHESALLTLSDAETGALVLDDIDKARPSEAAAQQLFCAIDSRVTSGKPLLVTSNLRLVELRDRYPHGGAITSRLAGYCEPLFLEGSDRRLERYGS